MVRVQSIQPTPNPNAFKFVCDELLFQGTKHYATAATAAGHPLAETLFAIAGVDTLFFCDRFVTVSMTPQADWRTVHEKATAALEAAKGLGGVVPTPVSAGTAASAATAASADQPTFEMTADERETLDKINALLDDRVRPALAGDGGGLEVVGLDGHTLQIRYQGACGTCPSSIAGTLVAIQNLLQTEIDENLMVVSA